MERKRRKKNKLRGRRTMGGGDTKNRRGAGTRGGRGRAGSEKHKRTKYFHEVGMLRKHKAKRKMVALNLSDVSRKIRALAGKKDVQKENGMVVFDGKKIGIGKILGTGELTEKAFFQNILFSRQAAQKAQKAGAIISGHKQEQQVE